MPLAVCATPIGNLDDVTVRVLAELRDADLVLCEDTRHTAGLLDRHGIAAAGRLRSYHEHNEAARIEELLPRLAAGERIALVSDAGMPGCQRPRCPPRLRGDRARHRRHRPAGGVGRRDGARRLGPVGEQYRFLGYLPRREAEREALWGQLRVWPHPSVGFESPKRLPAALRSLAAALPERRVAVCRELTKRFEDVVRGTAAAVSEAFAEAPKGEITLVIEGAGPAELHNASLVTAVAAVRELVAAGHSRRSAVELVAALDPAASERALQRISVV